MAYTKLREDEHLILRDHVWRICVALGEHRYEVDDAVCGDGDVYHLEFDEDFHLTRDRFVRKGLCS